MVKRFALYVYLVISFIILHSSCLAQISPGDLCEAHANLEGMSNCTLCHVLGDKVSNDKCLDCHKELKIRIERQKGYHVSTDVFGLECVSCHNDHHGRKFEVVRFQSDQFDHRKTGYMLEGAHSKKACNDCHKTEFITNPEIKKKKYTYLGLSADCLSCHEDYHQKTLSTDCLHCHDFEAFKPAPAFDHQKTKFKLIGKHTEVDCLKCHKKELKSGKDFQVFTGLKSDNCTACHVDVHKNKFGQDCRQCHSEQSFHNIKEMKGFDHDKTDFKLEGKHETVSCILCHRANLTGPLAHNLCMDCHTDYHEKQFVKDGISPDCIDCHTLTGFAGSTYTVERHAKSNFVLKEAHLTTPCNACHKKQDKWNFRQIGTNCSDCHTDYHEKQFVKDGKPIDCKACHTEKSFVGSLYSIENHALSKFPLKGAHLATPCFVCHKKQEKWSFRQLGSQCADCHENIHREFISEKYYPDADCKICHTENSWPDIRFDHTKTNYILQGAHKNQLCKDCHYKTGADGDRHQQFAGLSQHCSSCHKDNHRQQFEKYGVTDCNACHDFENWKVNTFDHDKTKFKLDGKHAVVACKECHKEIQAEGSNFVLYKLKRFKCEDCHH
ncbi:MAG: hypothetical protein HOO86_16280 [Bacteroidales bacterium]|nr:hypothetical protein [Bacteroidales bacterium]